MNKTFSINSKVVRAILAQYKELLEKQKEQITDSFHRQCIGQLQKLDTQKLKRILEAAFFASLEKEEGKPHHFSVIVSPPENKFSKLLGRYVHKHYCGYFHDVTSFETPLEVSKLHKLAPAFEFTNKKLRLWFYKKNQIKIWGFASRFFDDTCLEIKTFASGQLIIYIFSSEYPLIRYLMSISRTECIGSDFSLSKLLFTESELSERSNPQSENFERYYHRVLLRLGFLISVINKIRTHAHGGTLLVIPDENVKDILDDSIKKPITYKPDIIYDFIKRKLVDEENRRLDSNRVGVSSPDLFDKDVDFLGQITAVDGAAIVTKSFDVIAFGAKIQSKKLSNLENNDSSTKLNVWIKEPFENFKEHQQIISEVGGTRHQSTAQFVFDQKDKDVFAIVASQDGRISIIFWDADRNWEDEEGNIRKGIVTVFRHAEYLFFGVKI